MRKLLDKDYPKLVALLQEASLPTGDIDIKKHFFFGEFEGSNLIAMAGLELYGKDALLRSLIVSASYQRTGLGKRMLLEAHKYARKSGIEALYLLTETVPRFFEHMGYVVIDRNTVPQTVGQSTEFAEVCPDTAVCMTKHL